MLSKSNTGNNFMWVKISEFSSHINCVCNKILCFLIRGESENPDSAPWWPAGDAALPLTLDEQHRADGLQAFSTTSRGTFVNTGRGGRPWERDDDGEQPSLAERRGLGFTTCHYHDPQQPNVHDCKGKRTHATCVTMCWLWYKCE